MQSCYSHTLNVNCFLFIRMTVSVQLHSQTASVHETGHHARPSESTSSDGVSSSPHTTAKTLVILCSWHHPTERRSNASDQGSYTSLHQASVHLSTTLADRQCVVDKLWQRITKTILHITCRITYRSLLHNYLFQLLKVSFNDDKNICRCWPNMKAPNMACFIKGTSLVATNARYHIVE